MDRKDAKRFFDSLAKLSVMHRQKMDKATARIYYDALADVPIELLVKAMGRLVANAGEFMPTSGRIREVVDEVQDDQVEQIRREALKPPQRLALDGDVAAGPVDHTFCQKCGDTGMAKTCPGCADPSTCDRNRGDYCHEYRAGGYRLPVAPCDCVKTNPEILRKQKLNARVEKRYAGTRGRERRGGGDRRHWQDRNDE